MADRDISADFNGSAFPGIYCSTKCLLVRRGKSLIYVEKRQKQQQIRFSSHDSWHGTLKNPAEET
ncbi:hypothetical protein RUM44_001294 [Polyplax serrata]|uniref:Uncharacterized protein n=1 Tax=Polyplax serrata TaxID=468196 RepID=A0ABR1AKB9_POLSC